MIPETLEVGDTVSTEKLMGYNQPGLTGVNRPGSTIFVDSLSRNPMDKVLKKEPGEKIWSTPISL